MSDVHITSGTFIGNFNTSVIEVAGGGTIIIDADAVLFAYAPGAGDALELHGGPYSVTINGEVHSQVDDGIDLDTIGSFLSTVTVGANGIVFGASNGIEASHATHVTNAGTIQGGSTGLFEGGSGNFTISNAASGKIDGSDRGIFITNAGNHTINNAGNIFGSDFGIQSSLGVENVTNWGFIFGKISLGAGNDTFTDFKKSVT